jgi:hypothetical protein
VNVGEGDASLVGAVVDENRNGVPCATVELRLADDKVIRASTNRGGGFRISKYAYSYVRFYPSLRVVTSDGRMSGSIMPAHRTDGPTRHVFVVVPTGSIVGKVSHAREGDVVFLRYHVTDGTFATIAADGSFRVDQTPIGDYELIVIHPDDKRGPEVRVVVTAGKTAKVSLKR